MAAPKGTTEFRASVTSADTTTALTIKAGVAGKQIHVVDLVISVDTAGNYQLQDEDGTVVAEQLYLGANGGMAKTWDMPMQVASGKTLKILGSASGNVTIIANGYIQ